MSQTQWHHLCWQQHCPLAADPGSLLSYSPSRGSQTCSAHCRLSCAIWKKRVRINRQLSLEGRYCKNIVLVYFLSKDKSTAQKNQHCGELFHTSFKSSKTELPLSLRLWRIDFCNSFDQVKWLQQASTSIIFPSRTLKVKHTEGDAWIKLHKCEACLRFQGLGKLNMNIGCNRNYTVIVYLMHWTHTSYTVFCQQKGRYLIKLPTFHQPGWSSWR